MKQKLLIALFGLAFIVCLQPLQATTEPKPVEGSYIVNNNPRPLVLRSIEEFLTLTPKKYKELTGRKMSLPQKVSLKIAQQKVKKAVRKGKTVDLNAVAREVDTSDFNIAGFVLGLLLGIIGVLIAYLIGDSNIVKWAWIGFAVWVGLVLLVLIL
jgi:hypothetical protein